MELTTIIPVQQLNMKYDLLDIRHQVDEKMWELDEAAPEDFLNVYEATCDAQEEDDTDKYWNLYIILATWMEIV